ncbi:MAG TPA: S53 family serine peptidase, partial [Candidatus Acidoferrum sp.]|nr:S53 family serine peptidase [Candidatus Acidoferrum sp.]
APTQTLRTHMPAIVARFHLPAVGRLSATQHLRLNIMLPLRDTNGLVQFVKDVQNPASANFRHYLTPAQFNERFAPTEADYQTIIQFARTHHFTVTRTVPGRSLIEIDGAVADIERALHVALRLYNHPLEGRQFYAPDTEPTLELETPVVAITGLNNFTLPRTRARAQDQIELSKLRARLAGHSKGVSGVHNGTGSYTAWEDLFMGTDFRHSFASDTSLTGNGQTVAVLEWDSFTPADISEYESVAGLPNVNVVEARVGVSANPENGDLEVPLDIDMVMAIAPDVAEIAVIHGYNYDSILTEAADPTQGENFPFQIGCSIFGGADDNTPTCLARFAAQGQSFFYASGDIGAFPVEPSSGGVYISGEGSTDTQPFMVSVGGTHLVMNNNGASYNSELVWGGSSGGYQTPLAIPSFQQLINMGALGGSTVYRNVPDVAAPADNILVFCTGTNGSQSTYNVNGTSCAAPLWAGFASLANEQSQADGKPTIGYATPVIYAVAQGPSYAVAFHDVTSGNNTNSRSPNLFYAAKGYDLCTGWGSPNGENLINGLVNFASPIFVDFNYSGSPQNGRFETPFSTLAQGVSAVSNRGTIFIKTAGTSPETLTISKPMTITASDGAATVGQ